MLKTQKEKAVEYENALHSMRGILFGNRPIYAIRVGTNKYRFFIISDSKPTEITAWIANVFGHEDTTRPLLLEGPGITSKIESLAYDLSEELFGFRSNKVKMTLL